MVNDISTSCFKMATMRGHFIDPMTITVIKRRTAIILEGVSDGVFKSAN
jgi:hypothetical protein